MSRGSMPLTGTCLAPTAGRSGSVRSLPVSQLVSFLEAPRSHCGTLGTVCLVLGAEPAGHCHPTEPENARTDANVTSTGRERGFLPRPKGYAGYSHKSDLESFVQTPLNIFNLFSAGRQLKLLLESVVRCEKRTGPAHKSCPVCLGKHLPFYGELQGAAPKGSGMSGAKAHSGYFGSTSKGGSVANSTLPTPVLGDGRVPPTHPETQPGSSSFAQEELQGALPVGDSWLSRWEGALLAPTAGP